MNLTQFVRAQGELVAWLRDGGTIETYLAERQRQAYRTGNLESVRCVHPTHNPLTKGI